MSTRRTWIERCTTESCDDDGEEEKEEVEEDGEDDDSWYDERMNEDQAYYERCLAIFKPIWERAQVGKSFLF